MNDHVLVHTMIEVIYSVSGIALNEREVENIIMSLGDYGYRIRSDVGTEGSAEPALDRESASRKKPVTSEA